MINRILVNQNVLKGRRSAISRTFINPEKSNYSVEEEKAYIRTLKPMTQCFLNNIYGKTKNEQLNALNSEFIKNDFNISKANKNLLKNLEVVYKICKQLLNSKNKNSYLNTTVEIFCIAYDALRNRGNISFISSVYKKFRTKFREKVNVLSSLNTSMQFFYLGSLSNINMFIGLNNYVIYTGLMLLTEFHVKEYQTNGIFNAVAFDQGNASYTRKATYNIASIADYFTAVKQSKVTALLDKSYKEGLSKEDWRYTVKSTETLATVAVVSLGIALGLTLLMPAIRQFMYFIESLKVDLSNFFQDNADMLAVDIQILEEKKNSTTDKNEEKRLETVIQKSKSWHDRLTRWSNFWYAEQERAEDTSENLESSDDNSYQDTDFMKDDEPVSNYDEDDTRTVSEPDIFL